MRPATVIIIDDHPIIRMAVKVLLNQNSAIQVGLSTHDCKIALEYLRTNIVDLIIMDVELGGNDGFLLAKRMRMINSELRILFLSAKSEAVYGGQALQAGANGFISKQRDENDIYNAIESLLSGYSFFPTQTIKSMVFGKPSIKGEISLSNREMTVLRYLVRGLSNKEIAGLLQLSNKTISAHKANILAKLGLHSLVELIDYAHGHNLV